MLCKISVLGDGSPSDMAFHWSFPSREEGSWEWSIPVKIERNVTEIQCGGYFIRN